MVSEEVVVSEVAGTPPSAWDRDTAILGGKIVGGVVSGGIAWFAMIAIKKAYAGTSCVLNERAEAIDIIEYPSEPTEEQERVQQEAQERVQQEEARGEIIKGLSRIAQTVLRQSRTQGALLKITRARTVCCQEVVDSKLQLRLPMQLGILSGAQHLDNAMLVEHDSNMGRLVCSFLTHPKSTASAERSWYLVEKCDGEYRFRDKVIKIDSAETVTELWLSSTGELHLLNINGPNTLITEQEIKKLCYCPGGESLMNMVHGGLAKQGIEGPTVFLVTRREEKDRVIEAHTA